MGFFTLVKSMLPSFEKNRLLSEIDCVLKELDETVIPSFDISVDILKPKNIGSKAVKDFEKIFRRMNPTFNREWFTGLLDGLIKLESNLIKVRSIVETSFSKDITNAGLTYKKANLIKFIAISAFISKYARRFIRYVFILEMDTYKDVGLNMQDSLTKAEIVWLDTNFVEFAKAFKPFTMETDKVYKLLNDIPDIYITDENESVLSSVKASQIDPFGMNFIPINKINPIYMALNIYNQFAINRYKLQKEELRSIELRKLYLEKLINNGEPDAAIEKEIQYLDTRISDLSYKVNKFEESVE